MLFMLVSSPCKVILFGEHSVVYDKLGIAGAIDRRVAVSAEFSNNGVEFIQEYPNFPNFKRSKEQITQTFNKFKKLYDEKNFEEMKKMPFSDSIVVVVGELFDRYGYRDMKITIKLKNPIKSIGQSSAIFSCVTLAVSKLLGKNLSKEEIAKIAILGDVVAHGGTPSGIDTSTVIYGGYVQYRKSEGIKPLDIKFQLPLIIVDSGIPSKTSITVPHVRKLKEQKPDYVNPILDEMDKVAIEALDALKKEDLKKIGELMNKNHSLLQQLGVSSDTLDKLVDIARKNGALGAKMTAGGGGGCIIALAKSMEQAEDLIEVFDDNDFVAFSTKLGAEGIKVEQ